MNVIKKAINVENKNKLKSLLNYFNLIRIKQQNFNPENSILVMGVMRSGTSWLGEMVTKILNARSIFEPLNFPFTDFKDLGKGILYNDVSNKKNLVLNKTLEKIITGKLKPNYFVDKDNIKGIYEYRVIKSLRLVWLIDYISLNYPQVPILFIFRNPFACIRSQCEVAFNNKEQLTISKWYYKELLNNRKIENVLWNNIGKYYIESENYKIYKFASLAVHYSFVIKCSNKNDNIKFLNYENLINDPLKQQNQIIDFLKKFGFRTNKLPISDFRRPSRSTKKQEKKLVKKGKGLNKWLGYFDENEIEEFNNIIKHFELSDLYDENGNPINII